MDVCKCQKTSCTAMFLLYKDILPKRSKRQMDSELGCRVVFLQNLFMECKSFKLVKIVLISSWQQFCTTSRRQLPTLTLKKMQFPSVHFREYPCTLMSLEANKSLMKIHKYEVGGQLNRLWHVTDHADVCN